MKKRTGVLLCIIAYAICFAFAGLTAHKLHTVLQVKREQTQELNNIVSRLENINKLLEEMSK